MERRDVVTIKGHPLTLIGQEIKIGDRAPDFKVLDGELNEIGLKNFSGKIKIISVTPSLDTPVCDLQARRFNQEASKFPDDVAVLNISMDLPFAISRFCTSANIDRVKAYSDHREASFGAAYGVLIKELRLLARSIVVIDKNDVVRYVQIVPEVTDHPDYDMVLSSVGKLLDQQ